MYIYYTLINRHITFYTLLKYPISAVIVKTDCEMATQESELPIPMPEIPGYTPSNQRSARMAPAPEIPARQTNEPNRSNQRQQPRRPQDDQIVSTLHLNQPEIPTRPTNASSGSTSSTRTASQIYLSDLTHQSQNQTSGLQTEEIADSNQLVAYQPSGRDVPLVPLIPRSGPTIEFLEDIPASTSRTRNPTPPTTSMWTPGLVEPPTVIPWPGEPFPAQVRRRNPPPQADVFTFESDDGDVATRLQLRPINDFRPLAAVAGVLLFCLRVICALWEGLDRWLLRIVLDQSVPITRRAPPMSTRRRPLQWVSISPLPQDLYEEWRRLNGRAGMREGSIVTPPAPYYYDPARNEYGFYINDSGRME
jgi:hypothetical protein